MTVTVSGEKVRAAFMKAPGINTREDLVKAAGVDPKTVSLAWRPGGRTMAAGTAKKLAAALGVDPADLITEAG